jgi:hypothetical protein
MVQSIISQFALVAQSLHQHLSIQSILESHGQMSIGQVVFDVVIDTCMCSRSIRR